MKTKFKELKNEEIIKRSENLLRASKLSLKSDLIEEARRRKIIFNCE